MNAARVDRSHRLKTVIRYLKSRGKAGASTMDIIVDCGVCAVSAIVSEIRQGGFAVNCKCVGQGRFIYTWIGQ